jgi:uncharacterized membrane protein
MSHSTNCVAAALAACISAASLAGGTYIGFTPGVTPSGVSADGSVVVGYDGIGYFHYTASEGYIQVGGAPPGDGVGGSGTASDDGMRFSGSVLNPATNLYEMGIYDRSQGQWILCGGLGASSGSSTSSGWGLSGNGLVGVGLGWINAGSAHAIVWTAQNGVTSLGSTVTGRSTRANGTNADGRVVVGWQDALSGARQGCVWNNGVQTLIAQGSSPMGEAGACSADGSVVVGGGTSSNAFQAWRWTQAGGVQNIGPAPVSGWRGSSTSISGDGGTIVGFYRPWPAPATFGRGFIWTAQDGMRDLTDLAIEEGIAIPSGLTLALPLAISKDGRTVVGLASGGSGFAITFEPEYSPADINGDGAVNGVDLSALLANWGGSGTGDLDASGSVDGFDLAAMLAAWTG